MDISRGFIAQEQGLTFKNGKAVLNLAFTFLYDDTSETIFDFSGYVSSYLRVYDTLRQTRLIKNFTTQITRNSNVLVMNCSVLDMTFNEAGRYWYEMGYVNSGYDVALRYGEILIIN